VYALGEEEERKEKISAEDSFRVENFVYSKQGTTDSLRGKARRACARAGGDF
jgi:hypothetical protein